MAWVRMTGGEPSGAGFPANLFEYGISRVVDNLTGGSSKSTTTNLISPTITSGRYLYVSGTHTRSSNTLSMTVLVSTNGTTYNAVSSGTVTASFNRAIDLKNYVGQKIYVRIECINTGTSTYTFNFNNVYIE